ncbi:alkaline-phosphatase-like protein, partial [Pavlovales sp. CCMP2436]
PICTPARAALLKGRMPQRYGLAADVLPQRVFFTPGAPAELPRSELTLATELKAAGYATGMAGKWHLSADNRFAFMPAMHGFDESL